MSTRHSILLVDDNPSVASAMEIAFRLAGHRLDVANGPEEALSRLATTRFDAILLDLNFSPGRSDGREGLQLLARIVGEDPSACVIVITAHSGIRIAVAAMQSGACDFVMKPWRNAELLTKVQDAIARRFAPSSPSVSAPSPHRAAEPVRLLGESAAMERLRDLVRKVGPTSAGVTVTGASGSGRTLTALTIHAASEHAAEEALRIDVRDTALWPRLERVAGTVILRYPDHLDLVEQARLLEHLDPDSRCIAIVDRIGMLSPALRRRIATIEIEVPPLASRGDDAVLLARHFVRLASERFSRPAAKLSTGAEAAIRDMTWVDEVRGIALAMDRAVLLTESDTIEAAAFMASGLTVPRDIPLARGSEAGFDLGDAERMMIEAALREHRHNISHAAVALGLSRGALYRRMARHGL